MWFMCYKGCPPPTWQMVRDGGAPIAVPSELVLLCGLGALGHGISAPALCVVRALPNARICHRRWEPGHKGSRVATGPARPMSMYSRVQTWF